MRSPWRYSIKSQTIAWWLEKIERLGWIEFDNLKSYTTEGAREEHPYQWIATTKVRPGDDDPFEGIGWSPYDAVRNLYYVLKDAEIDPKPIGE